MKRGAVVWFTGLPSSGKSTLARAVLTALEGKAVLLDSDELRAALEPKPGYTPRARAGFYRTLANLAALIAAQGHVVLVPATANRRSFRAYARRVAPRFVEVFVDTPADECARRDAKGLYRAGVKLPGRGDVYEAPVRPEVIARGGASNEAVAACLRRI